MKFIIVLQIIDIERMKNMNSKQRLITALDGKKADRLPVTTHHIMNYFLEKYMGGKSDIEFFKEMKLDPIRWVQELKPNDTSKEYIKDGYLQSDDWRIESKTYMRGGYKTTENIIHTPKKALKVITQGNEYTSWIVEHIIKEKADIGIIASYAPISVCDVQKVNEIVRDSGDQCLIRGTVACFPFFGQPGSWQDIACLMGIEPLIMATFDDPKWVHEFLSIISKRKQIFINSTEGALFDLIEFGGGDASSTVISPKILNDFIVPYDAPVIAKANELGQRIVYHTCGGMMPILEDLASMKPAALETFTPKGMGGDADLREAKRRIGDQVCMIGGFDQGQFFYNSTEAKTREAVRRCFEEAGEGGGFILSPSDHFFDANPALIRAFADEAAKCVY